MCRSEGVGVSPYLMMWDSTLKYSRGQINNPGVKCTRARARVPLPYPAHTLTGKTACIVLTAHAHAQGMCSMCPYLSAIMYLRAGWAPIAIDWAPTVLSIYRHTSMHYAPMPRAQQQQQQHTSTHTARGTVTKAALCD